jgi:hypothetical protein
MRRALLYLSLVPFLISACSKPDPLAERVGEAALDCLETQNHFYCDRALKAAENLSTVAEEGSPCATDSVFLQSKILDFEIDQGEESRKSTLDAIASLKKYCTVSTWDR